MNQHTHWARRASNDARPGPSAFGGSTREEPVKRVKLTGPMLQNNNTKKDSHEIAISALAIRLWLLPDRCWGGGGVIEADEGVHAFLRLHRMVVRWCKLHRPNRVQARRCCLDTRPFRFGRCCGLADRRG